jgi:hypothetical protein
MISVEFSRRVIQQQRSGSRPQGLQKFELRKDQRCRKELLLSS